MGVYSSYISGLLVKLSEHCWSDLLVQIKTPSYSSIQQAVIVVKFCFPKSRVNCSPCIFIVACCVFFCANHPLNNLVLIRSLYRYIFMLSVVVSVCLACWEQVNFSKKDKLCFIIFRK